MRRFLLTGHVDHGKSTLGGQLLYQCGAFEEREIQKIFLQAEQDKMYSFRWARLLDINTEEQERGVTIEANEVEFTYQNNKYKLIDTPGHKLYIRHLIEAIYRNSSHATSEHGNIVGVLVLSAISGDIAAATSSGQIKEDILLLRAIGVDSLVVAINKLDKFINPTDARSAFDSAKSSISNILKLARFKNVAYAACSGLEGTGIIDVNGSFTDIPPLIDSINTLSVTHNLPIDNLSLPKTVNTFTAEIFILNCNIFSAGYTGIIHMKQGEYTFTIQNLEKILSDKSSRKSPFIKSGERGLVTISIDNYVTANSKDRIVLRNNDSTIAYGVVIF